MPDLTINIVVNHLGTPSSDVDPENREILGLPMPTNILSELRTALATQQAAYKEVLVTFTVQAPP